jgi:WD40 repeat protein
MTTEFGQDFSFDIQQEEKFSGKSHGDIIDARTDQRWINQIESLVKREDWQELWHLAQKAPPIWTVRILKFLRKKSFRPEGEVQFFYSRLSGFADACNEFDLPGPKTRSPRTASLFSSDVDTKRPIPLSNTHSPQRSSGIKKDRITSARVTADGEFLYVLDDKGTSIEIRKIDDLSPIARIRVDHIDGKQFALLAFAISQYGDRLATLLFEPKTAESQILVYEFLGGELSVERRFTITNNDIGKQTPRLAFSGSGDKLALLMALNQIKIWDIDSGTVTQSFENIAKVEEQDFVGHAYQIRIDATFQDWQKYGRWAISENRSRGIGLNYDGSVLAAERGNILNVWDLSANRNVSSVGSENHVLISSDGKRVITVEGSSIKCWLPSTSRHIAVTVCLDPTLRLALSHDAEVLVASMSHRGAATLWHLPDGRHLGTLYGLARDYLADLKITDGGSIIAVTRSGLVQTWESDGNGNAWPWSKELVQITHQPVDSSSVKVLRQAQEMRRRGWLSVQESNLLDLALSLMQHRLNLDIEIEWDSELPGDVFDIEIE